MRQLALIGAVGALLPLAGCNSTKWSMFRGKEDQPRVSTATPTAAALVSYLNNNADRVKSFRCDDLHLQCSQGLGIVRTVGLDGKLIYQKPRNFRLAASSSVKQELDLGSNDQEFWYWIARGDPYQFHCSHEALAQGKVRQLPFPIQPDWLIEAMGLAKCGPADRYQVVVKKDTVELVEKTKSPQGKMVRKVTVFRSRPATNGEPQVMAHLLIDDATGKEICSAQITQVQLDRGTNAYLPRKVTLFWQEGKIKLAMTLDQVTVNREITNAKVVFTRPRLTNVKSYDLAQGTVSGGIQQVDDRTR
jgi:outer membrane lipoprotein-sorting protein